MNEEKNKRKKEGDRLAEKFVEKIGRKEQRKIKARSEDRSIWYGLGMFGLIGWSVAIPTLIGVALGLWLDRRLDDQVSWTLTLLIVGLFVGCLNAWFWMKKEGKGD